jgi:hypothetical protein
VPEELIFTQLESPMRAGCDVRDAQQCANDATWAVTWNASQSMKLLCTDHRKELKEKPDLLAKWFQIGPVPG